jgi:hypothetical protein
MGQHCALLWLIELSHRDVSVTRRGTAPMGLIHYLADTKIATSYGGIIVPLNHFSAAKVYNSLDMSKFSCYFFKKNTICL